MTLQPGNAQGSAATEASFHLPGQAEQLQFQRIAANAMKEGQTSTTAIFQAGILVDSIFTALTPDVVPLVQTVTTSESLPTTRNISGTSAHTVSLRPEQR